MAGSPRIIAQQPDPDHKQFAAVLALVKDKPSALDMTTKCRRSAQFDRAHDATLRSA
jgi:hypothetical protein